MAAMTVEQLLEKIKSKHPHPPGVAGEILIGVLRRLDDGLKPTDGQMKFVRALARSKDIREDGRPSAWAGKWLGTDW